MGGRIWVNSDAGKGSTFHFTLKIGPPPGAVAETRNLPPGLSGKNVLVIEHRPMHQETLKHHVQFLGMNPKLVSGSAEGIQEIRNGSAFDAVIVSSRLPGTNALDLVKQIRSEAATRKVRLILMTPQHVRQQFELSDESCVSSILLEPVRETQFRETFETAFEIQSETPSLEKKTAHLDKDFASRFPLRVMIAEDNSVNQLIALGFLSKLGYRADVVSNGSEAIASLERQPYDLIFMDVQMPEMDGLEASRRIRDRWTDARKPVIIAMTANAMQGDRDKCVQAGMDDYIPKPISIQAIKTIMERWAKRIFESRPDGAVKG